MSQNQQNILAGSNSFYKKGYNHQKEFNATLKEVELSLNEEILAYFNSKGLELESFRIYHSTPFDTHKNALLSFDKYANGLTYAILKVKDQVPVFDFTVCSKEDNFSRLEGRLYLKKRILHKLKEKGLEGLYPNPSKEEYKYHVNPRKIGNHIIKHNILPKKVKVVEQNPASIFTEKEILEQVKVYLKDKYDIVAETLETYVQHIRVYDNKYFTNLLCTQEWYQKLEDPHKQLQNYGGYTFYALIGQTAKTKEKLAVITCTSCSKKDVFNKSLGRNQALINLTKGTHNVFSYNQEAEDFNELLLAYAMKFLETSINTSFD